MLFIILLWLLLWDCLLAPPVSEAQSTKGLQDLPWRCQIEQSSAKPINFEDCIGLEQAIKRLGPPRVKLLFSTKVGPNTDYVVPITFTYESCSAVVGPIVKGGDGGDYLYLKYLANKVLVMAQLCVYPAPHLGGSGQIGSEETLALTLHGPKPRPGRIVDLNSNLTAIQ